jgi:hypothetical protein
VEAVGHHSILLRDSFGQEVSENAEPLRAWHEAAEQASGRTRTAADVDPPRGD